ncbi:MAG: glycosyltransferase family 39 protein [Elusimicrobia bacterium]|nr:glycosyltransferase family 39 protein [Elusimicrobiota bacterium]
MPANIAKYLFSGRAAFVFLALILIAGCVVRIRRYEGESRREVSGYYSLAVNLNETGVFAYPGSRYTPTAYRAPLYPAFLYPFAGEAAKDMRAAFFAQLALFLLASLLVWAAAGSLTGSHAAALTAAAVYSFHPLGVFYSVSFNVEFFYGFLIAALVLAVVRAAAERGGNERLVYCVRSGRHLH